MGALNTLLATLALTALLAACGTDGGAQPEDRGDAEPVTKQVWPDSWPVPPLPVMALEHQSGLVWGSPSSYCWRFGKAAEPVCEQYSSGSGVSTYPELVPGKQVHRQDRLRDEAGQDVRPGVHQGREHHGRLLAAWYEVSRARSRPGSRAITTSASKGSGSTTRPRITSNGGTTRSATCSD